MWWAFNRAIPVYPIETPKMLVSVRITKNKIPVVLIFKLPKSQDN